MAKSYPRGYAASVPAREWMSQSDAASSLGVSVASVGWLLACGHLEPAECAERTYGLATGPSLEPGVTRASVDKEVMWRSEASVGKRWLCRLKDMLNWI